MIQGLICISYGDEAMKHKSMIRVRGFILSILVMACATASLLSTTPALAASPVSQILTVTTATCNANGGSVSGTFTKTLNVAAIEVITLRINGQIQFQTAATPLNPQNISGNWGLSWFLGTSPGYPYRWEWEWLYSVNGSTVWRNTAGFDCNNGVPAVFVTNEDLTLGTPTWFNPGDDRVDPRPGDRIAVYCNRPNEVTVMGIADDLPSNKSGFPLVTFSYKDIVDAGERGLTRDAGAMGTVSISLNKGWFWVAWNGGKYKATGRGIFTKNFADDTWCSRAHNN
jgi:hypothetical protein